MGGERSGRRPPRGRPSLFFASCGQQLSRVRVCLVGIQSMRRLKSKSAKTERSSSVCHILNGLACVFFARVTPHLIQWRNRNQLVHWDRQQKKPLPFFSPRDPSPLKNLAEPCARLNTAVWLGVMSVQQWNETKCQDVLPPPAVHL